MTTTPYYSLIYHFNNEKSSTAISRDKNKLLDLHNKSILDPNCYYHKYKNNIINITCELIKCYTYNSKTKTLDPYCNNDKIKISNGKFYAINRYPIDDKTLDEILIYTTVDIHKKWRFCSKGKKILRDLDNDTPKFFYDELISNEVIDDTYYAEGIMNA